MSLIYLALSNPKVENREMQARPRTLGGLVLLA